MHCCHDTLTVNCDGGWNPSLKEEKKIVNGNHYLFISQYATYVAFKELYLERKKKESKKRQKIRVC